MTKPTPEDIADLLAALPTYEAAAWYMRYQHPYFKHGPMRDIVATVRQMADNGECAPEGIQRQDGSFTSWSDDQDVRLIEQALDKLDDYMWAPDPDYVPPPMKKIRPPWPSHTIQVRADTPGWIGTPADS